MKHTPKPGEWHSILFWVRVNNRDFWIFSKYVASFWVYPLHLQNKFLEMHPCHSSSFFIVSFYLWNTGLITGFQNQFYNFDYYTKLSVVLYPFVKYWIGKKFQKNRVFNLITDYRIDAVNLIDDPESPKVNWTPSRLSLHFHLSSRCTSSTQTLFYGPLSFVASSHSEHETGRE